jgi:hypothetical protein
VVALADPGRDAFGLVELGALRTRYPELELTEPGVVDGILKLHASYNGQVVADTFKIRITARPSHPLRLPSLSEVGGRTQSIAAKYGFSDLRVLHHNPDGTACLCVKQEEKEKYPPGSDLIVFVESLVVPYLYGLACYDLNQSWPWPERSHGALGLLEFYADDTTERPMQELVEVASLIRHEHNWKEYQKQIRKPSGERGCLCGSTKGFEHCHSLAWRGVLRLNSEARRRKLKTFR